MGAADPWFLSGEERNLQEKRGRKEERTPGADSSYIGSKTVVVGSSGLKQPKEMART
jgi:hypothetical protein